MIYIYIDIYIDIYFHIFIDIYTMLLITCTRTKRLGWWAKPGSEVALDELAASRQRQPGGNLDAAALQEHKSNNIIHFSASD